jgi:S-adenosylmethionine:tRNA ribosyltransferase-isomerase
MTRAREELTLTHAAGISSTGDKELDSYLPLPEPYRIPETTAVAIRRAKTQGGRIVAVGTSVVRALEHAATIDGNVKAGEGLATQHIGAGSRLRVVDAIVSGTHEPGTSHYELLRAFVDDGTLNRTITEMDERGYMTHEFGDSVFIENSHAISQRK